MSNLYTVEGQEQVAKRLCELTFADRVFFCNSGTEAVELAIKAARRYHHSRGDISRNQIITLEGGFHGRTLGALAATGRDEYLKGFEPRNPGFLQVPFGDFEELESAVSEQTAGILLEPVQGEGGVRTIPCSYIRRVRELCDRHNVLMLLDEVQTGIGRTGRLFGYEESGVVPDIVAVAKGLGGGFPVGAVLATESVGIAMQPGSHGSTFGGNPLAMSVAKVVLDIVSAPAFLERVRMASIRLRKQAELLVSMYSLAFDGVTGAGLLVGLRCIPPVREVVNMLYEQKLLCVPAGNNVLRLVPPLTVSDDEIDDAMRKIARVGKAICDMSVKRRKSLTDAAV
ncbi:acetylornithine and succinylornithine aminotransferase [Paraburkholderia hospita]|uniref:Acetylornithine and succinylornithine aminotransferase n=1 Tax=Paraburkholderia hospita TaxID=169430 RepID=A0ABP2P8T0_9BURK|nr:acetylornithine and succinylornithine aminotransferase [Paraburkholderia hospita]